MANGGVEIGYLAAPEWNNLNLNLPRSGGWGRSDPKKGIRIGNAYPRDPRGEEAVRSGGRSVFPAEPGGRSRAPSRRRVGKKICLSGNRMVTGEGAVW